MITLNGTVIKPTIFPDGTSQIWKIEIPQVLPFQIVWEFEEEREIIDLLSLVRLLESQPHIDMNDIYVHIPYLPYGRQDKEISNTTTFNRCILESILNLLDVHVITTLDAHSDTDGRVISIEPVVEIELAVKLFCPDLVIFPDEGARQRYDSLIREIGVNAIHATKNRDSSTGIIKSISLSNGGIPDFATNILIVDDICDGGATFVELAKHIWKGSGGAQHLGLYVTHGLFTKGTKVLTDAGISSIYTRKGKII